PPKEHDACLSRNREVPRSALRSWSADPAHEAPRVEKLFGRTVFDGVRVGHEETLERGRGHPIDRSRRRVVGFGLRTHVRWRADFFVATRDPRGPAPAPVVPRARAEHDVCADERSRRTVEENRLVEEGTAIE